MQKKLIALAVAGLASTAAFAQVTVYGVLDGTFDMVKVSGSTTPGNDVSRYNRVSANSSLLGFRGTEDLGGGMSALYQFESSMGFDATGGTLNARDSYVGIGGAFGKILLGNLTGPTRGLGATVDVYSGATGIGANAALIGKIAQGNGTTGANSDITLPACTTRSATCASVFDNRWKNSVAYVSPAIGPVILTAVYVADENRSRQGLNGSATQIDTKGYDVGVRFEQGPIMVGLTRNWADFGDVQKTKAAVTRVAAKFNFGVGDVRALFDSVSMENNAVVAPAIAAVDLERKIYGAGVTFNVGSGKIVGQVYKANDVEAAGVKQVNTGATFTTVGYEHSLTKRTMLKAVYARVGNKDAANFDYGVNASGVVAAGGIVTGVSAGIRHTF